MKKKIAKILTGIAHILVGTFILVSSRTTTFSCHRVGAERHPCKLTSSGILGSQTTQIPLEDLHGAIVQKGRNRTYKVVLLTKTRKMPLTFSSDIRYGSKQKMADRINYFLRHPTEPVLAVKERVWWVLHLVSGLAFVSGIAFVLGLI
jgi:hypothetical protein